VVGGNTLGSLRFLGPPDLIKVSGHAARGTAVRVSSVISVLVTTSTATGPQHNGRPGQTQLSKTVFNYKRENVLGPYSGGGHVQYVSDGNFDPPECLRIPSSEQQVMKINSRPSPPFTLSVAVLKLGYSRFRRPYIPVHNRTVYKYDFVS